MNPHLYAFDIETDTTVNGLDPAQSHITTIAVVNKDSTWSVHITSAVHERDMLEQLAAHLDSLEPGILAGWNSSAFDLPFLADRARTVGADNLADMLQLEHDPERVTKYAPLPGHPGAYRAQIGQHAHLDVAYAYQGVAAESGMNWSLKPVADWYGLNPVMTDASRLHTISGYEIERYCQSDARITWHLADRLEDIERWVDKTSISS